VTLILTVNELAMVWACGSHFVTEATLNEIGCMTAGWVIGGQNHDDQQNTQVNPRDTLQLRSQPAAFDLTYRMT
jgi:hypothetical protein